MPAIESANTHSLKRLYANPPLHGTISMSYRRHKKNPEFAVSQGPDSCPTCKAHQVPIDLEIPFWTDANRNVYLAFLCTNPKCRRPFYGVFIDVGTQQTIDGKYLPAFDYLESIPYQPSVTPPLPNIAAVSPSFYGILGEAEKAEGYGLSEIAGPGYRKALEFLIKDYATRETREKKVTADEANDVAAANAADAEIQAIRKMALGNVIANRIADDDIKQMAQRAAWLGNDETHYTRIWKGHDLQDLKHLISLVMGFVDRREQARRYIEQMPNPG